MKPVLLVFEKGDTLTLRRKYHKYLILTTINVYERYRYRSYHLFNLLLFHIVSSRGEDVKNPIFSSYLHTFLFLSYFLKGLKGNSKMNLATGLPDITLPATTKRKVI